MNLFFVVNEGRSIEDEKLVEVDVDTGSGLLLHAINKIISSGFMIAIISILFLKRMNNIGIISGLEFLISLFLHQIFKTDIPTSRFSFHLFMPPF